MKSKLFVRNSIFTLALATVSLGTACSGGGFLGGSPGRSAARAPASADQAEAEADSWDYTLDTAMSTQLESAVFWADLTHGDDAFEIDGYAFSGVKYALETSRDDLTTSELSDLTTRDVLEGLGVDVAALMTSDDDASREEGLEVLERMYESAGAAVAGEGEAAMFLLQQAPPPKMPSDPNAKNNGPCTTDFRTAIGCGGKSYNDTFKNLDTSGACNKVTEDATRFATLAKNDLVYGSEILRRYQNQKLAEQDKPAISYSDFTKQFGKGPDDPAWRDLDSEVAGRSEKVGDADLGLYNKGRDLWGLTQGGITMANQKHAALGCQ